MQRGRRGRRVHLTASISFAAIVSFMIFDPCLIMIFDTKPAPPRRYDIFLARLSWGEAPSQNPAVDGHITHDCTRTVSSVGTSRTMAVLVRAARTVLSFLVLFIHFQLSPSFLFLSSNTASRNSNVFLFSTTGKHLFKCSLLCGLLKEMDAVKILKY